MIYLDKDTKCLVQGITGKQGSFHTEQMLEYNTNIVAGVTPGKGGQDFMGVPIFNSIAEAKENCEINASIIFVPAKFAKDGHPAKRTFQAIRIEVNNEIKPLYNTITDSIECLKQGGRLCVITFHSLEDRAVKKAYADNIGKCTCPKDLPYCICGNKKMGEIITKKPIIPTKEEIEKNPRSKSAKLRVFEKI